jgi:tRNA(adenine34) deaminase
MSNETIQSNDLGWMQKALVLARAAAAMGEAPIGAIIVDPATQTLIASAHNQPITDHDPSSHAELLAIRRAGLALGNYRLQADLTLYVTLEPCTMCAGVISQARIARLVYGAPDIKGGAIDNGVRFFAQPTCHWRPQVTGGIMADESSAILKAFFKARRQGGGLAAMTSPVANPDISA